MQVLPVLCSIFKCGICFSSPVQEERKNAKGETQWHFDLQQKLRASIVASGLPFRNFEGAVDAATMIREVGLRKNEPLPLLKRKTRTRFWCDFMPLAISVASLK